MGSFCVLQMMKILFVFAHQLRKDLGEYRFQRYHQSGDADVPWYWSYDLKLSQWYLRHLHASAERARNVSVSVQAGVHGRKCQNTRREIIWERTPIPGSFRVGHEEMPCVG